MDTIPDSFVKMLLESDVFTLYQEATGFLDTNYLFLQGKQMSHLGYLR